MQSDGVELIYWAGTESGLMDIYIFPGVIYATDGSKGSMGMGAGFYCHDTNIRKIHLLDSNFFLITNVI